VQVAAVALGALAVAAASGWVGLQMKPARFEPVRPAPAEPATVPLPAGLPAPVERFYRQLYGERIPLIRTVVVSGRGRMAPFGLMVPMRYRFVHEAGRNYRHYIEMTLFGRPVIKVDEYFVGGKERQVFPWGVAENDPKLDQGGNMGMWAEAIRWFPAILLTDPRVRWEAVDSNTARLVVPFGAAEDDFTIRFDEADGTIRSIEGMRYRNTKGEKELWINGMWAADGKPWLLLEEEEVVYNGPVDASMEAKGP
jgi:hypothetical protein